MEIKAFISGLTGLAISAEEQAFFRDQNPWGFILFARNIDTPDQVQMLCDTLRESVGRGDAPVLIDQEGGRVQRLRPPHWTQYPAGAALGTLYSKNAGKGKRAAWLMSRLHAFDLLPLGITVNCLPVLDVPAPDCSVAIGDRAYGPSADIVAELGEAAADGLTSGGVKPVMKHMPGHGRANVDSHKELPFVDASIAELTDRDFVPFGKLKSCRMAMTAHLVYRALDAEHPATTSRTIIDTIIRGQLAFDGLLMTDDLSMHALSGDFADRTRAVFEAGCDIALHCNGIMAEMQGVASATPGLQGDAMIRAQNAMKGVGQADDADEADCREEFEQLMNEIALG